MLKAKKYENYKPSGVDYITDIPSHWEVKKLKYVATLIKTGSTPSAKKGDYFTDGIINWYSPSDFNDDFYLKSSTKKVISKAVEDKEVAIYEKGSILFTGVGSVGKVGMITEKASCNQQINIIELNRDFSNIYAMYLLYIIGLEVKKYAKATILPIFNQDETKSLNITVPPIYEQTKIADFLDIKNKEIEEFISYKQKQIALLEEQKEAIINKAVTKGLNETIEFKDSGIEWIGDIPKHWKVKKLKFLADVMGSNVDKLTKEDEIPVLLCNYTDVYKNDVITNGIDFMEATATDLEIAKFLIKKDDVIITKDSETADDMAVPTYVAENFDNVLCGYHLSLIRTYGELQGKFLYYLFTARDFNIRFELHSNGVTRFGLGSGVIKNTLIAYPSQNEQEQIIEFIQIELLKIDEIINQIEKEIDLIEEYKISLISEVVTGQIDVR
ncbi:MAG: restriction endonuclease subunit S [Campylobacterales bacterium]|nr:restriction endonuclease subunit S [Campylobacterales bacterium]